MHTRYIHDNTRGLCTVVPSFVMYFWFQVDGKLAACSLPQSDLPARDLLIVASTVDVQSVPFLSLVLCRSYILHVNK